jgi:predicted Co/Zn/Cd cation transporter (cation efflux family)
MDRDSRDKFAADLRRQEVISPDWRKVRLSALFAVVLALAGLGLGRLDPAYTGIEYALYAAASAFGLAVLALMQWRRLFIKKPPME